MTQDLTKVQKFLDVKDPFKRNKYLRRVDARGVARTYNGPKRQEAVRDRLQRRVGNLHSPYGVTLTTVEMAKLCAEQGVKVTASQLEFRCLSRKPQYKDYYRIRPDGTKWPPVIHKEINPHRYTKGKTPWNKGMRLARFDRLERRVKQLENIVKRLTKNS